MIIVTVVILYLTLGRLCHNLRVTAMGVGRYVIKLRLRSIHACSVLYIQLRMRSIMDFWSTETRQPSAIHNSLHARIVIYTLLSVVS